MLNLERTVHLLGFRVFLLCLLISANASAQQYEVITKITKDSIAIKWLPYNYFALRALQNGATIYRIDTGSESNLNTLNYSSGKKWVIDPLEERFNALNPEDSLDAKAIALLEPVMDWVSKEQQNFAFGTVVIENVSNPDFQYILGNILIDKTFEKNKKYAYKIEVEGIPAAYVFVDTRKKTSYSPITLSLALDQKKTVVCSWDFKSIEKESFAFDIEHSIGEPQTGKFLTDVPFMPFTSEFENRTDATYRHEELEEGMFHFYRVSGRDAFGKSALFSEWEKIYVPKRIHAFVQIDSIVPEANRRTVFVRTSLLKKNANIESVQILRSSNREDSYELIESTPYVDSIMTFTIEGEKTTGDHFYYSAQLICEDDTVSSLPFYFFTLDQEPPAEPTDLSVEIDSSGIARINWTPPLDNDIMGYRVFRGNQMKEEFVERTTVLNATPSFTDTLRLDNLTSEVYYFVRSVDLNYNNSINSDTILGVKPDTIPPVPCVLKSVEISEKGLLISWIESDSEDRLSSTLFRDNVEVGIFEGEYIDTSLTFGKTYTYQLKTEDQSGNESFSNKISGFYEPGFRPSLDATIKKNIEKKRIEISWNLPQEELYAIEIYRSLKGEKLRYWKTIKETGDTTIFDKNVQIGEDYVYSVKYITKDGIHSIPSELEISY